MPGDFSKANPPIRPGAYTHFQARSAPTVTGSSLDVLALPIVHNWGPDGVATKVGSLQQFNAIFSDGGASKNPAVYTGGYRAVYGAFQGEGLTGIGGANEVIVYRMCGSAGARSSRVITNTTPANAAKIWGIYKGSKGNDLRFAVVANVRNGVVSTTYKDFVIYDGLFEIERFRFDKDLIVGAGGLADIINRGSDWCRITGPAVATLNVQNPDLTGLIDAVEIADQSTPLALSGGNDGSTLVAGDWTSMMTALEAQRFSLISPFNLTDGSVLTSFVAWVEAQNVKGKRMMAVVGGALDETAANALDRSHTEDASGMTTGGINSPNFVNLGVGAYTVELFGTTSTAQLAPRVAGILARNSDTRNLTFARLAGVDIETGPSDSQILDCIQGGVVVIAQDSHPTAPVHLVKGVTTWLLTADPEKPVSIFGNPKYVRTMHLLERTITEFAEFNIIGKLPVNSSTVELLIGFSSRHLEIKEAQGVVQPGWGIQRDFDPPPTPQDEFIGVQYDLVFGRSLEQVRNTINIS